MNIGISVNTLEENEVLVTILSADFMLGFLLSIFFSKLIFYSLVDPSKNFNILMLLPVTHRDSLN